MKAALFALIICISFVNTPTPERVDTLTVMSQAMHKQIENLVITPKTYADPEKTFPVLYLLHGAGGDYTSWNSSVPELTEYANQYNIIIVCPDGGKTSWYLDSPIDPKFKYETYMVDELVKAVDSEYRTKKTATYRAISGLSMGGHGALYLAIKHPDIWGAAGSMSGGVDIRPFPKNWDLPKRLGTKKDHPENWEEHTVINKVNQLKKTDLKLIIDCGTEDFFIEVNRDLHKKLEEQGISHEYSERPGAHNWEYWTNSIENHMKFFNQFFQENMN